MNIIWKGSPNFSKGRGGKKISTIVLHWIVGYLPAADATFAKANSTSAHYAVGPGVIHQYVNEENTAWHAGNFDVNQRSIGIEHEGGPTIPITDAVYNTSIELVADICRRNGITPSSDTIKPHRAFKATQCPGVLDVDRIIRGVQDKLKGGNMELTRDQKLQGYLALARREPSEAELNLQRTTPEFYLGFADEIDRRVTAAYNEGYSKGKAEAPVKEVIKEVPVEVIKEVPVEKIVYQDKPLTLGQAISFIGDVVKNYFKKENK